jgi:hypothetical protein
VHAVDERQVDRRRSEQLLARVAGEEVVARHPDDSRRRWKLDQRCITGVDADGDLGGAGQGQRGPGLHAYFQIAAGRERSVQRDQNVAVGGARHEQCAQLALQARVFRVALEHPREVLNTCASLSGAQQHFATQRSRQQMIRVLCQHCFDQRHALLALTHDEARDGLA